MNQIQPTGGSIFIQFTTYHQVSDVLYSVTQGAADLSYMEWHGGTWTLRLAPPGDRNTTRWVQTGKCVSYSTPAAAAPVIRMGCDPEGVLTHPTRNAVRKPANTISTSTRSVNCCVWQGWDRAAQNEQCMAASGQRTHKMVCVCLLSPSTPVHIVGTHCPHHRPARMCTPAESWLLRVPIFDTAIHAGPASFGSNPASDSLESVGCIVFNRIESQPHTNCRREFAPRTTPPPEFCCVAKTKNTSIIFSETHSFSPGAKGQPSRLVQCPWEYELPLNLEKRGDRLCSNHVILSL
ncbi:hypothetical protein C8R43DRAFT_948271 [Mycena crocata]|nr:hypothetical protein C8R43DRAFT_948271 [Mycena crocata]